MLSVGVLLMLSLATGGDNVALVIDGRAMSLEPGAFVEGGFGYVPLEAFAKLVEREVKIAGDGAFAVLCTPKHCVPVSLNDDHARMRGGMRFVRIDDLASGLGMTVRVADGKVVLKSAAREQGTLSVGSMVPDVAMRDLKGDVVRLSDFSGQRVLICTWASW